MLISKGDNAFKGINWNVSCGSPDSSILSLLVEICRNLFWSFVAGHFPQVFLHKKQQQEINKHRIMITAARKSLNLCRSKKSSPRIISRTSSRPSLSKGGSTPIINLSCCTSFNGMGSILNGSDTEVEWFFISKYFGEKQNLIPSSAILSSSR